MTCDVKFITPSYNYVYETISKYPNNPALRLGREHFPAKTFDTTINEFNPIIEKGIKTLDKSIKCLERTLRKIRPSINTEQLDTKIIIRNNHSNTSKIPALYLDIKLKNPTHENMSRIKKRIWEKKLARGMDLIYNLIANLFPHVKFNINCKLVSDNLISHIAGDLTEAVDKIASIEIDFNINCRPNTAGFTDYIRSNENIDHIIPYVVNGGSYSDIQAQVGDELVPVELAPVIVRNLLAQVNTDNWERLSLITGTKPEGQFVIGHGIRSLFFTDINIQDLFMLPSSIWVCLLKPISFISYVITYAAEDTGEFTGIDLDRDGVGRLLDILNIPITDLRPQPF